MNPKPKPTLDAENTQQFSAADVKAEGLKSYRSPRNQQQQQSKSYVTEIVSLIVCGVVVLGMFAVVAWAMYLMVTVGVR